MTKVVPENNERERKREKDTDKDLSFYCLVITKTLIKEFLCTIIVGVNSFQIELQQNVESKSFSKVQTFLP